MAAQIDQLDRLTPEQVDAVIALRDEATGPDGASPLSDHVIVGLREGRAGERHVIQRSDSMLTGYAHVDANHRAEIAVAPGADPAALIDELVAVAGDDLQLWARGDSSALREVLELRGFVVERELIRMRRPMAVPLDPPTWPAGVSVRTFVVGQDETAWLEVNNLAFADHPEQAGWVIDDITTREQESWFDAAGFFLAERDGELVGFHWTKVHDGRGRNSQRLGEVYVIGVSPVMQGQRLGAALALHGLAHLQRLGLATVMLYVEATNHGAIGLYEKLAFTRWDADRLFKAP